MNDMIERVARAIAGHNGYDPDDMSESHNIGGPMWMAFAQEARAAIEAMREPTTSMLYAGWHAGRYASDTGRTAYQAMINTALKQ